MIGTMRYQDFKQIRGSETIRYYSHNKALGPDRITEKGMKYRDKKVIKDIRDFMEGRLDLKDMKTDLILLPKKEGPAAVNEHRPIALMSHRTKAKDHAVVMYW
jgi:hypothetical protein